MKIKPHKEYPELVQQLSDRGMIINNPTYAEKKLSQVGYYRLSGFWHISRKPNQDNTLSDQFLDHVVFEEVYKLYIFDKKLRLLLLDIIERLEINIRTIIAHEIAKQFNVDENTLRNWLNEINIIRNLSAHHSRVWNKSFTDIAIPDFSNPNLSKFKKANAYFSKVALEQKARSRIFGRIAVLWYLVSQTSKNYHWLDKFGELLKDFPDVPNAKIELMGISDSNLALIYNS